MDGRTSGPTCAKCGKAVPAEAGFCPACGNPTGATTSLPTSLPTALPTIAPTAATPGIPPRQAPAEAQTVSPTYIPTSLDSPSPRPAVRSGDGPFQPGQQVGPRYTILKLLGTGGMGAVYQAFDHELGVAVAIKVIRPSAQSDATAAKELEQRFKRELVLARQVTHKYVVRIHDLGEIDGTKYLTMPFVEGETLAQVLRREQTLPLDRVIKISQQIAQGLAAAHEKGVVHRDLKPENIMIEKAAEDPLPNGGDALIMDFGIARSVEHGATQTMAGSVIGTLEYMAPEQAQGKKVDGRADQYSFGLIIYDMLVGRSQRMANRENPMAELLERMAAAPKAPRAINPAIPEAVDAIVMKLLAPNPESRYESTAAVVAALDRLAPDGSIRSDIHEVVIHDAPARSKLAAAAIIIVLAGAAAGWYFSSGSVMTSVQAARDPITVLIGDFENRTGDPVFDGVVEQALSLGIEGASFIATIPRRDALRAAAAIKPGSRLDEATARLVALREMVGVVLVGAIERRGDSYHLTVRGIDGGTDGQEKFSIEDDAASKAEVLATVGTIASSVRTALGDTDMPAGGAGAKETFTVANIEAASAYAAAQELQALNRRDEAIAKYQEALQHDPDFGRAYSGLAGQYVASGRAIEAEQNYKEALARIDRMTEREKLRTLGQYYMFARKNDQAVEQFLTLLKTYPYDTTGLPNLALANFYLRKFSDSMEHGRKAVALQPKSVLRRYNLALYAMYAGQFEAAIAEANEALALNATTLKAFVARALSELALGKTAEATATYESLAKTSPDNASFATAGLADIAIIEGRLTDAAAILAGGIADDLARKNPSMAAHKRVALAEIKLARGDASAAVRDAQAAVAEAPTDIIRSLAGLVIARAGRREDATALALALENRLEPDPQAYGKLIRAELALATNQARAAVELAREANKLANTWLGRVILGRAYLELGEYPDAHTELDTAMKRQGEATAVMLDDVPTYRFFPAVHYYLGRSEEGIRSAGAAQSYKTFLAFVKSDEAANRLVADARSRLAKIGS
jgi:tetratricopeptide (TPR) repeat protein/tRNA A-37 threonylcarbamoyl transferase component Bud32